MNNTTAKYLGYLIGAAIALTAHYAHAGNLAYAQNQAGGLIVLTDESRDCPTGTKAYFSTAENGMDEIHGCYAYSEPLIYAKSSTGDMNQWNSERFTVTQYFKNLAKAKSGRSM